MTTIEFLRQFRLGEYAIFDLVGSFLGVYLLSPLLSKLFSKIRIDISRKSWLFLTLPISILVHLLSGNITAMTENFLNLQGHFILKIMIILMLIFGIKDIKILPKKNKSNEKK